jgi:methyl-accepting chemotaxis protein
MMRPAAMPEPDATPRQGRLKRLGESTFTRLLAGLLAASLPITLVLAVLLTETAGRSLSDAVRTGLRTTADTLANRTDALASARLTDVRVAAGEIPGSDQARVERDLRALVDVRGGFDSAQVLTPGGRVRASSRPAAPLGGPGERWFAAAMGGRATVGDIEREGDNLRWIVAAPVLDARGRPTAVVAADLDATRLFSFVRAARLGEEGDAWLIAPSGAKLLALGDGAPADEAEMVTRGALRQRPDSDSVRTALGGRSGSGEGEEMGDATVATGYAPVPGLGWAAVVTQEEGEAFSAVGDQKRLAVLVVLVGAVLSTLFAWWFARRFTRPILALATGARRVARGDLSARVEPDGPTELQDLGRSFNLMVESLTGLVGHIRGAAAELSTAATELSTASEELAATTSQQSSAATETSATMEELARTSTSIADTTADVSERTGDTRAVLEEADRDIRRSSERTLALADRVGEISGLLELINEIADQTNLLALNAAIEAARAGEAGRGFTVVADEVRRLAERSKASASDIGEIIASTQDETNATVMTMEQSSKQMQHGLELMDSVADQTDQVRLTTQQQGAATRQVVVTMETVTETTRQTSVTAQQIAASAAGLTELVDELGRAAAAASAAAENGGAAEPEDEPEEAPPPGSGGNGRAAADGAAVGNGVARTPR